MSAPLMVARGSRLAALRSASPIALAGLVANAANTGVTLLVARMLTTRGYGALAQLIAVFFVLSMPGSALQVGVVRRVTGWQRLGQAERIAGWAHRTRRRALLIVAVWTLVAWSVRKPLAEQLSLPNADGLAEVLTAGGIWGLLCLERGLLQAQHAYRALAANLLVEGLSRCCVTVALVGVGFGVEGAALAVLVSVLLAEWQGVQALTGAERSGKQQHHSSAPQFAEHRLARAGERRSLAADVGTALVALALLAILQNVDVVVLGRQAPANTGSYAAISVACKALVLGAFVLAGFLLPEAAARRHEGQHALHQLAAALAVVAVPGGLLLAVSILAPKTLLSLAFGPRLTGAAPAFAFLAGAMACLAATVLFTHYLLAVGRRVVLVLLAAGAALTLVLLLPANGAVVGTAQANLLGQAAVTVMTGVAVLFVSGQRPRLR